MTLPLGILAVVLDKFEDKIPALQEVTKATQRSVLALLGGKFKPVLGLIISIALGMKSVQKETATTTATTKSKILTRYPSLQFVNNLW